MRTAVATYAAIAAACALLVVAPWQHAPSAPYGAYLAACKQHHVLVQCLESLTRWER
jgi:hypothetical protein